jgi:hypothetical protein
VTPFIRRALVAALVAEHLLFVIAPLDVLSPVDPWRIGRAVWQGEIPYADFGFEYPPLAIAAFPLPGAVPHGLAPAVLALQAIAAEALVYRYVIRPRGRGAVDRYLLASLLVFPFLSGGFDALAMLTIAVSTVLLAAGAPAGWRAAAAGTLVKLAPGAAWVWSRRALGTAVVALAVTAAVALAPLALADDSDDTYVGWTLHRGVQIESLAASVAWVGDRIQGDEPHFEYRYRAWEIAGANGAGVAVAVIAGVALAALAVRAHRLEPWHAALAAVALLMLGGKVLSPQFISWLAPLAAIVGGRVFALYVAGAALTIGIYSVGGTGSAFMWLASLRNAVLVCVVVASVREAFQPPPAAVDLHTQVVE